MKTFAVALFGYAAADRRSFSAEDLLFQKSSSVSYSADGSGVIASADGHGLANTDWDFCNKRVTSNLGGYGGQSYDEDGEEISTPADAAEEIRYHKVGFINGKEVDFRVTLVGAKTAYRPKDPSKNGLKERTCVGQLNVKHGKQAHVKFALVLTGTDVVAPPQNTVKQNFTVLDFDRSEKNLVEVVWAKGFANVDDTRINHTRIDGDWYVFEANESNQEVYDEDIALDALTDEQLAATLGLTFANTNEWEMIFKAEGTGNGRNFLFAGDTSSCIGEPECECVNVRPQMNPTQLACYVKWNICDAEVERDVGGHVLRYKNVATLGTDAEDCPSGVFGTGGGGQALDLIVDNLTPYKAYNVKQNGKSGCLGVLNLKSLTDAHMKFTLVKSGTDEVVPSDPQHPFTTDFNIFDFDQSTAGMQEYVGLDGFDRIHLNSKSTSKDVDEQGITWLKSETVAVDNPTTDIRRKLTSEQIKSSFSVSYRGTATWDVVFKVDKVAGASTQKTGGRNFLFSGETCASWRLHQCRCPKGQKKRSGR